MTPRQFFELIAKPNVNEMAEDVSDIRLVFNAAAAVDSLAAYIFHWADDIGHWKAVECNHDDGQFRGWLAKHSQDFRLTYEVAKANKHVRLARSKPIVRKAAQVHERALTIDEVASFDDWRLDMHTQIVIEVSNSPPLYAMADAVIRRALDFLSLQMSAFGIP
jgi:hypothetical protein